MVGKDHRKLRPEIANMKTKSLVRYKDAFRFKMAEQGKATLG